MHSSLSTKRRQNLQQRLSLPSQFFCVTVTLEENRQIFMLNYFINPHYSIPTKLQYFKFVLSFISFSYLQFVFQLSNHFILKATFNFAFQSLHFGLIILLIPQCQDFLQNFLIRLTKHLFAILQALQPQPLIEPRPILVQILV